MPAPIVCRICLGEDIKLYKYDRFDLKYYYEQIMGLSMNARDGLPIYFCYECAALLHKFHKFKEKCHTGMEAAKELKWKGSISLQSIRRIDRESKNLESSINLISVNHRVRTYIVKSKEKTKLKKKARKIEINFEEPSSVSVDDDYIDNSEDEELPPVPELIGLPKIPEIETVNIERNCSVIVFNDSVMHEESNLMFDEKSNMADEKILIGEEKKDIDDEKISLDDEKLVIDEEKILEIGEEFTDDDRLIGNEEKIFVSVNNIKNTEDEQEDSELDVTKKVVSKKKRKTKGTKSKRKEKEPCNNENDIDDHVDNYDGKKKRRKKFSQNAPKKNGLDPNNWLKYNLNEDEALAEFKSKAVQKRFAAAEYKCHDCLKGFSKEDMLNRHIKLRHSESLGPIECRFCRMRFKWKCFLRKHMRQHYTKYKCLRCDLVCPLETTALFHEEYHNGVIRKCTHCGEEFKHLTTYYTHLRSHRSEHVCKLCGASFVSAIGLKIHKKIKHLNKEPEITEDAQGKEYCKRCDIKFETVKAYDEHLIHSAMHVEGIEDLESQTTPSANPKKRRQNPKKMPRIPTDCHICGKHFATQAACRKHHLAEHPRTSFFAPNERQICEICGISLAPGSVSSHLNTHTREKIYSCSTCGRQFSSKGGMTTHQLTHTSEKPVACTLCDKRFKQISSMKLHYRTFHLKEPYPKRNRKKRDEMLKLDEFPQEESDENMTLDRWR